jgi:hypothetical protein
MQRHRGQVRALVLFAKFAGEAPAQQRAPEHASRLFDAGQVGSLTHFYRAMSSGQFELVGDLLPKRYASTRPASALVATEAGKLGNFGEFVREILQQAEADVDFARYDNDGPNPFSAWCLKELGWIGPDNERLVEAEGDLAGEAAGVAGLQAGLSPGHPNPSNASTLISLQLALAGEVELEIYDLLGQRVRVLAGEELAPGIHQRRWDGRDQRGLPVASGVYFCRLRTSSQVFSQRLLLLK